MYHWWCSINDTVMVHFTKMYFIVAVYHNCNKLIIIKRLMYFMCFGNFCICRLTAHRVRKLLSESICMVMIASCLYSKHLPVYLHSPTDYRLSSTAVRHGFMRSGVLSEEGLIWKRVRGSWTRWTSWEIANLCLCCILRRCSKCHYKAVEKL